jgi:polysaccharide chain length determinant protein (PEP-CTERM system associated)
MSGSPYSPDALLTFAWRRKWRILLPTLVIAAAASWWIHRLPDRYRAYAMLLIVPQRVPESIVQSAVPMRSSDRLASITQQILSRAKLESIIEDFDLYASKSATAPAQEDAVESMRTRDIEIRPIKGDAFRLGFVADSPEVAKGVVDRLVSLFIVQSTVDRASAADGTDQFLEARLQDAKRKLIDNEAQVADYRRHHNGELPAQLDANVRGVHDTELQLQALTDSLNRDRDRQLLLERSIKDVNLTELVEAPKREEAAGTSAPSAAQQLERAEAALRQLQATLTEQHPDIVAMRQTIADLRQRAERESVRQVAIGEGSRAEILRRSQLEDLRAELSAVRGQIAQKTAESERLRRVLTDYQRRIEGAPAREAEIAALTRDYDTLQQTYRGLLAKKQEAETAADLERRQIGAQFKVLDPAGVPAEPFAPNRARLYALAVVGALAMGVIFALSIEQFHRGLRTQDEVIAALGLPVLAVIPFVAPPRSRGRRIATVAAGAAVIVAGVAVLVWRFWMQAGGAWK